MMKITVTIKVECDDGRKAAVQQHVAGVPRDLLSLADGDEKVLEVVDQEWNVFEVTPDKIPEEPAEPAIVN
jgi:hypothetical protein